MKIRLPPDLKNRIEASAKASGRSMNAEIVQRLEQSFDEGSTAAALRGELERERIANRVRAIEARARLIAASLLARTFLAFRDAIESVPGQTLPESYVGAVEVAELLAADPLEGANQLLLDLGELKPMLAPQSGDPQ